MAIPTPSREAEAAQRFFEASRNVERAFRALRGESRELPAALTHGVAQSRLDRALDELAHAQAWFDSVTDGQARADAGHRDH
ncbi:hypothetical protein [Paraburkholderia acidisoli]|uniref:Uncharacterized protein n=1 Tax=Paraburkholderia acidisoli TaxID=2571748 RepID=A0A7Z2JHL3_9BURK|nr:hypothetical protein [Paraburkholderia acidisoli]QGZ65887.1 hypothetical protein FAZ98_29030 [Paraburkholderia acidisoli]